MNPPMIDPFAQAIPEAAREDYWAAVELALKDIFHIPAQIAEEIARGYRIVVDDSPIGEQVAVYHSHPYNIALDLARRASKGPEWTNASLPDSKKLDQMYDEFANQRAAQQRP
ncbi:hypothetical protein [Paraburkholderia sediminicola]|uniref:hypothetical protein n=1 Tax=Paraburkholderia sediminicola TaxID=458836 RepID=UPI0038B9C650